MSVIVQTPYRPGLFESGRLGAIKAVRGPWPGHIIRRRARSGELHWVGSTDWDVCALRTSSRLRPCHLAQGAQRAVSADWLGSTDWDVCALWTSSMLRPGHFAQGVECSIPTATVASMSDHCSGRARAQRVLARVVRDLHQSQSIGSLAHVAPVLAW